MLAVAERESLGGSVSYEFPHKLVNTVKAAAICGVSRRTIYNWVRDNRVAWVRTPTGQLRIVATSLFQRKD